MNHAGLYIHIPFCQAKCGYCSFNSVPANRATANTYLQAIHSQALNYSVTPPVSIIVFDSIFFGGGTPTLASVETLSQLLHSLHRHFHISPNSEISIEANPNTVTLRDLTTLRKAGFNRISLGVQSFHADLLTIMERTHTGKQAMQAVRWAREAGFTNISCDLIYGLPNQTLGHWQKDLQHILDLQPDHLSLYELSIEPDTAFHRQMQAGTLSLPNEDILADMEDCSKDILPPLFDQYEISNFAAQGKQCRHNLTYWQNGTYLGLGAGAVSCIDGTRFTHHPSATRFGTAIKQNTSTISHTETLETKARFRETIIMGLRLVKGVNILRLEEQLQLNRHEVYGDVLADLIAKNHLHYDAPYLRIPQPLLGVANQILHQLV